jgi:hypothetical protein
VNWHFPLLHKRKSLDIFCLFLDSSRKLIFFYRLVVRADGIDSFYLRNRMGRGCHVIIYSYGCEAMNQSRVPHLLPTTKYVRCSVTHSFFYSVGTYVLQGLRFDRRKRGHALALVRVWGMACVLSSPCSTTCPSRFTNQNQNMNLFKATTTTLTPFIETVNILSAA